MIETTACRIGFHYIFHTGDGEKRGRSVLCQQKKAFDQWSPR